MEPSFEQLGKVLKITMKMTENALRLYKILQIVLWVFVISIAIIPAWYFFANIRNESFTSSTMGNWFATILGIVIGIPIALSINNLQQKADEYAKRKAKFQNKVHLLELLENALIKNRDLVKQMCDELKNQVIFYNVDTTLLEATASQKYDLIEDYELNQSLDSIRYELQHLHRKVNMQLDFWAESTENIGDETIEKRNIIVGSITQQSKRILSEIDGALAKIKLSQYDFTV